MAASKEDVFFKHGDVSISLLELIEEYCKTHGLPSIPTALEPELYNKKQDAWVALECKDIGIKVVSKVENIEEDEETDSSESENLNKEDVFFKHGDVSISLLELIEEYYCKTLGLPSIPTALKPELYNKNQCTWDALECKDIGIKVVRQVENIEEDEETDSSESENLNKTTCKDEILKEEDRNTNQLESSGRRCIPSESDYFSTKCEELKNVESGPIRGKNYEEVSSSLLKLSSEFMANILCAMKGVGAIIVGSGQTFCGCRVSEHLVLIPNHGLKKILESSSDVMIRFHSFADEPSSNSYIEKQVSNFQLDKSKFFTDNVRSGLDFALVAIKKPSNINDQILLNEATILTNVCPKTKTDLLGTCIYLSFFSRRDCDQFLKVRVEIIPLEDEHSEALKALNRDRNMILYVADTEEGYSGAPLFNDRAEIVGIHLGTKTLTCRRSDTSRKYHIGYGLLITAILRDLYVSLSGEETPFELMLKNSNMSSEIPFPYNQQELKKSTTRDHSAQREKIKDHVRTPEL